MEVLTEVEPDRIATLRARDEFFWLDLRAPSQAQLDVVGELLGADREAVRSALSEFRSVKRRMQLRGEVRGVRVVDDQGQDEAGGEIVTLVGTGVSGFSGDGGPAAVAQLANPRAVAPAADGGLLIADAANNRIRKFDPTTAWISTGEGGSIEGRA